MPPFFENILFNIPIQCACILIAMYLQNMLQLCGMLDVYFPYNYSGSHEKLVCRFLQY